MRTFTTNIQRPIGYVMHPYTQPIRGQYIGRLGDGEGDALPWYASTWVVFALGMGAGVAVTRVAQIWCSGR